MPTTQTTISIFGDSITFGACDEEKGGWAKRLKLYFKENCNNTKVCNLGVCGDTTKEVLKRFYDNSCVKVSNKIIFAIGTNDSTFLPQEEKNFVLINKFENNIKELILKSKEITKDIVFIGLTPVDEELTKSILWEMTNSNIKIYNNKIKEICKKEKIKFIDLYDQFIAIKDYKNLLADGLHPNSKGHQLIFEIIKKTL